MEIKTILVRIILIRFTLLVVLIEGFYLIEMNENKSVEAGIKFTQI